MRKISYKEILIRIYEDTDIQNLNINELLLTRKIKNIDKSINGLYAVTMNKLKVTITDNIIEFPVDAFNIDFILLGDLMDDNQYFVNPNEQYVNINFVESWDNENTWFYKVWSDISFGAERTKIDYIIADGKIQVNPDFEGQEVTVFYTSYPLNTNGDFLVNDTHAEAIINSIKCFVFEKDMFRKKMQGKRLYTDDYNFHRLLKSDKNISIRNAQVQDTDLNKKYLDKDAVNVYNVLIENDIY